MLAEQRRHQIMLQLQRSGQARTHQLADDFGVSEVTIRSDLEILDTKKQLIKTHGGAIALPVDSPAAAFEERMQRNFNANGASRKWRRA
jgi:DeoR family transcriptional regulator, aga operon transcriptional repressor